jgi:hypothetical protein
MKRPRFQLPQLDAISAELVVGGMLVALLLRWLF